MLHVYIWGDNFWTWKRRTASWLVNMVRAGLGMPSSVLAPPSVLVRAVLVVMRSVLSTYLLCWMLSIGMAFISPSCRSVAPKAVDDALLQDEIYHFVLVFHSR